MITYYTYDYYIYIFVYICKIVFHFRWSLLYGRPILAAAAAYTGFYINLRFRKKLKLGNYGWASTVIGLTISPTVTTALCYSEVQSMDKN